MLGAQGHVGDLGSTLGHEMKMKPYYHRYDDHYRTLYSHGFHYWSDGPDHCAKNIERVTGRLLELRPEPDGLELLDVGCGEGQLASPIADLGINYSGVDCSPHAIEKARNRVSGVQAACFVVADALHLDSAVLRRGYDIVLDQACYHIFVLDADRRRYLSNVARLLRDDGVFLMFNQCVDEEADHGEILSIEQYEEVFNHDLAQPHEWEAWNGEKWSPVELPSFAARPCPTEQYVCELAGAGLTVLKTHSQAHSNGPPMMDFVAVKKDDGTASGAS